MPDAGQEPGGDDEALAWRNALALRLLRAVLVIFSASGVIQTMVIHPNVVLDRFGSTFTFDLGANVPVNRIVVYGRNMSYQSGFSVLGR